MTTRWTNRQLDAARGQLEMASRAAHVLWWTDGKADGPYTAEALERQIDGCLHEAADALGFDLVERKPKNASRRGLALAETPEGDHA